MRVIEYELQLISDAEPGTGLGGNLVNDYVPRDADGRPFIPASHIKGLLREELEIIQSLIPDEGKIKPIIKTCLGTPGEHPATSQNSAVDDEMHIRNGRESLCRFTDLTIDATEDVFTSFVTRTKINAETGRAEDHSLRTTEAIPAGTVFHGKIYLEETKEASVIEAAVKLGLLAIKAIGANRTRGCGQCVITFEGDDSEIVERLYTTLTQPSQDTDHKLSGNQYDLRHLSDQSHSEVIVVRLFFEAEGPICCPEVPVRTGPIKTGFTIPASAVQGLLVTQIAKRLNLHNTEKKEVDVWIKNHILDNSLFRTWPMLPCGVTIPKNAADKEDLSLLPIPTRVGLSHQIVKNSVKTFRDDSLYEYQDSETLIPEDGVLLRYSEGHVKLWKSDDMTHIVTAHGVHSDPKTPRSRNLYQVDSMSPMIWSGVAVLPCRVFKILEELLKENSHITLGRSRSVRGLGRLTMLRIEDESHVPWSKVEYSSQTPKKEGTVLITQSPIASEQTVDNPLQKDYLKKIIVDSWKDEIREDEIEVLYASSGIRFGWDRSNGDDNAGLKGNRLAAVRVILPGAVFRITSRMEESTLKKLIQNGLGGYKKRGFGVVSVHPDVASDIFHDVSNTSGKKKPDKSPELKAITMALEIWKAHQHTMPSASQIYALMDEIGDNANNAIEYLERQANDRTSRIAAVWKPIEGKVQKLLANKHAKAGLKLLADLAAAQKLTQE